MIYLYEKAIIDDLRYQLGDSRVSILPPDILFRSVADISAKDEVLLPIVSLSRIGYSFNEPPHSNPESIDGKNYIIKDDEGNIVDYVQLQRIPITCKWQMDVISRSRQDNDNLSRELLYYYINNPSLKVRIPYGINADYKFSIFIDPDIDDNSDIESHASRGEYFRTTINLTCSDANLWKVTKDKPKKLKIQYSVIEEDDTESDITQLPEKNNKKGLE